MYEFNIKRDESCAVIKSLQPPPGFLFLSSAALTQLLILRHKEREASSGCSFTPWQHYPSIHAPVVFSGYSDKNIELYAELITINQLIETESKVFGRQITSFDDVSKRSTSLLLVEHTFHLICDKFDSCNLRLLPMASVS